MRRALQYHGITGRRVAPHCEEPTLSRNGQMHEGPVSAELGFAGYPSVAESVMVERDLALARYEQQPIHLLHLSARESVEALSSAQAAGVRATGEATPHHLVLTDEAVRSLDANLKMNPPLRSADDRAALIDAVRDGTISVIATDHAPHAAHEKDVPFEEAPFGVTGLETAFAALNTHLVEPGAADAVHAARADVRRARPRVRAGYAAHRQGCPRQPRAPRPGGCVARRRARVQVPVGELLAPR